MTDIDELLKRMGQDFGERGAAAAKRVRAWLAGELPYAYPEAIAEHLKAGKLDLLYDAFWQVLPFGTGGRRGRVGYGANRLNPTTVAMTVQGHCQFLAQAFPDVQELSVVVANDVRVFWDAGATYSFLGEGHPLLGLSSRKLARLACQIYGGNGIVAYLAAPGDPAGVLATPELAFAIRRLGAQGGINLSASHNPPDDNGVKVYDEEGGQPVAPQDQHLSQIMDEVREIRQISFEEGRERGLVRALPADLHRGYVKTYVDLYAGLFEPRQDLPVTYTPLCGCGLTTVGDVLREVGFPLEVPPDQGPDGTFSVIPLQAPNPEVPHSTEPARAFAEARGSDIVLSSDPDADRVGAEVRLADGSWYHLDGNQIAVLLCHFLMLHPRGPRRRGLVMETLVTTKMLGEIVKKAGDSWLIDDLLVGFKYMANVLKQLESSGRYGDVTCRVEDLVLATEESHGVLVVPDIRDKDATPACLYLAALYQILRLEGRTLLDYYVEIVEEMGEFDTVNRSIMMLGAEGMTKKERIMASLRDSPPATLAGRVVRGVLDYWDEERFGPVQSETDRMSRNVLQFETEGLVVTIRPSGTEPKLKLYCQLLPGGAASEVRGMELLRASRATAQRAAGDVYNELLARIGTSMGEVALLLPDIVDLEQKLAFERRSVPQLRELLASGELGGLEDVLNWLRGETAGMTPGSDPLPALRGPVALLCNQWREDLASQPVLSELGRWATAERSG